MTAIQYLNAFRVYGADVLLLALGVTLVTSLLKKTVFKHCLKKACVFLPFAVGLVFYAAYRALVTLSAEPFTSGLAATFEGGFACGCAATLYYVVYEQFFRAKEPLPPVAALIEGIVPEEAIAETAETLIAGAREKTDETLCAFVKETLEARADESVTEAELFLCARTVTEFLRKTNP
jgi:hypothetical protein